MADATTHTAVYEPGQARVRINLAGFQAGTAAVQVRRRVVATGRVTLVRGGRAIPINNPATDTVQLFDYEFPAGELVRYEYTQGYSDLTNYVVAADASYDIDAVWLKHVTRPYLNRVITIRGYEPYAHQLRAGVYPISRRNTPVARLDVRGGRTFGIEVDAPTLDDRDALDDFLAVGGVWLLHVPADVDTVPGGYVVATDASERRTGRAQSIRRVFELSLAEVAPPDWDVIGSGITWQGVKDEWASWGDVLLARATWADLLSTVAAPTDVEVV